jgi:predicted type IV restriction endonuclease
MVENKALSKWELAVRDRISQKLKSFQKSTQTLIDQDAVEANTRLLVTDFLCYALGFDKYSDLDAELNVSGDFADYGIRINGQLVAIVEVKRIKQTLNATHLRQAESYALREGVQWIFLTNGQIWQIYHVDPKKNEKADRQLVLSVDLLDPSSRSPKKIDALVYFSKEFISKGKVDELWRAKAALSPKMVSDSILAEESLTAIRREIRRKTKENVDQDELKQVIQSLLAN